MSFLDWVSIVSSVLTIIAFVLKLFGMEKEKKRQKYSYRSSINFKIENRNIIQSSRPNQNNTQSGSGAATFVGVVALLLAILFVLYRGKIENIIICNLVTISITGIFTALRVIRGKESYLPSRNPLMKILFLLSPVIVVSSYPFSRYLSSHTSVLYYSKITAALSLNTQNWISSILTITAATLLLLTQLCSILIPTTHGLLRRTLVKIMKLWWAPILLMLSELLMSFAPYIRNLPINNLK